MFLKASHKDEMALLRTEYAEGKVCGCYASYPKKEVDKEGGLRTKGIYKVDTEQLPLVTYITVVYNRVEVLERCMQSIWAQTYSNVEYIIIDGASTDGTLQLIEENEDKIDYYISQPDSGIYNAMNKGIALARGRFLCFMNSDDECMPWAAEKAMEEYKITGADIICGTRELRVQGNPVPEVTYPRYGIKHCNFRYIQMYHQATYASYEVFDIIGGFDEKYSLLADWVWESAAIDAGAYVDFCGEIMTIFNYDGASAKGIIKRDDEWIKWIMCSFPKIAQKDAELFLYSLDRERHPLFDLKTIDKIAVLYLKDEVFFKMYYETILLICIEMCVDIDAMMSKTKININRIFYRYVGLNGDIHQYNDLQGWLDKKLRESINEGCEREFAEREKTFKMLEKIRKFQIDVFCRLYAKQNLGMQHGLTFNAIGRTSYYAASRQAGKSVELSRKFYPRIRATWDTD